MHYIKYLRLRSRVSWCLILRLNLSPPNKFLSAILLVCFNFQSASTSLKVCENVVWVSNSLDPGGTSLSVYIYSYSMAYGTSMFSLYKLQWRHQCPVGTISNLKKMFTCKNKFAIFSCFQSNILLLCNQIVKQSRSQMLSNIKVINDL